MLPDLGSHAQSRTEPRNWFNSAARLLSPLELREPNYRCGQAPMMKKVHLPHTHQKRETWFPEEHQMFGERSKRDKYCLILIQSKFKFSDSAKKQQTYKCDRKQLYNCLWHAVCIKYILLAQVVSISNYN